MNQANDRHSACEGTWKRSGLEGKLGPPLLLLGRLVTRRLERALVEEGLGLTPAQARILLALHFHGPLNQQSLAVHTEVDPSTLVSTLDVMERDGMAVRDKKPGDRRAHLVSLTERGERRVPRLFELWDAVEADLTRDMSAEKRKRMLGMVQQLIGRLHAGDPPCG
ncbi:MAG TPA: MarR family transcriptional regulator [Gemmatimonadota bacterium]|nr:MarR family transcriptional regulator [Gemmatimonadota bacterium]